MAALPPSGELKISDIRAQLSIPTKTDFSLDRAENGDTAFGYQKINLCSEYKPSDTDPATFSEWYRYNHSANCNSYKRSAVYSNYTSALCDSTPTNIPPLEDSTSEQTSFIFDADYIIITYQFTNGSDLDIRARVASPNIGQDSASKYLGFDRLSQFPTSGVPIIKWGNDNRGTGLESLYINVIRFKQLYPSATEIVTDLRCFWFAEVGSNPVKISATMYKGGTIVETAHTDGTFIPLDRYTYYTYSNNGYTAIGAAQSSLKVITDYDPIGRTNGERLATLTYNLTSKTGTFNINDTTTPSV
jgi:hypothetical protein